MSITLGELIYEIGLEDGDFQKKMKTNEARMGAFADVAENTGKKLTTGLTLPILGLGTVALKLAADFEVSSRKFGKAFEGAGDEAADSIEKLNEQYGIAESQATQLLGFTGDLLKGFGATSNEALVLAESTNILAASLSAYNGVPVAQASEAVTKALLGERESLKLLGVVISEEAVKRQLLLDGTDKLTGQELLLAKANATLTLAYEQSSDAVASFNENTDTAAFMTQALIGDMKDLAVQFGTILLPVLKDVLDEVSTLIEEFSELDDETKENIIQTLALVAALGPVVSVLGNVVKAVKGVSVAFAFLAANPLIAAITALGAVSIAVGAVIKQSKEKKIEELSEQFTELGESTGIAAENLQDFVLSAGEVSDALSRGDFGASFSEINDQVSSLAENMGLTKDQVIEIGLSSKNLSDSFKSNLEVIKEQRDILKDQNDFEEEQLYFKRQRNEVTKEIVESEKIITEELISQIELRESIEDKYQSALDDYKDIIDSEKLESELLKEQIVQYTRLSDGSAAYNKARSEALEILTKNYNKALSDELNATQEQRQKLIDAEFDRLTEIDKKEKESADNRVKLENKAIADKLKLNEDYINAVSSGLDSTFNLLNSLATASSDDLDDLLVSAGDALIQIGITSGNIFLAGAGLAAKLVGEISNLFDSLNDNNEAFKDATIQVSQEIADEQNRIYKEQLDREFEETIENINRIEQAKIDAYVATLTQIEIEALRAAGVIEETELQRIDRELKAAIAADDAEAINLLENEKEIEEIRAEQADARTQVEKDYLNAVSQFEYDKAVADKEIKKAEIKIANEVAQAALPWYTSNSDRRDLRDLYQDLYNTVSSLNIPSPVFLEHGGIIPSTTGGTRAILGEAGSEEAVIPLNDAFFNKLASAAQGSTQGTTTDNTGNNGGMVINNILDGDIISKTVVNNINNRRFLIDSRSVRS